jgi:hypothetical protein
MKKKLWCRKKKQQPMLKTLTVLILLWCTLIALVAGGDIWQVGTGRRRITPSVDGSQDYVVDLYGDPYSTYFEQAGTFVRKFDDGIINVGNGNPDAHWVHDHLHARAIAIGPDPRGKTSVFAVAELYMLFEPDLKQYHELLRDAVGDDLYDSLHIVVHAQHNHEGPDTGGVGVPINHKYFAFMINRTVEATVEALETRRPATLHYGMAPFYFGLGDIRDPRLEDNNVRVVRALSVDDDVEPPSVIATLVQWNFHPEVMLSYSPPFNASNCTALPPLSGGDECSAKSRFFSADFPGYFSRRMIELQGGTGEALYLNGAIGAQIGNHAPVWTVTDEHPLDNGEHMPAGAVSLPRSFYKAFVIGTGLANFTAALADSGGAAHPVPYVPFDHRAAGFYVRMTNFFFNVGASPASALGGSRSRPLFLGDRIRPSYTCEPIDAPSDGTCVPDGDRWKYDPLTKLPYRLGTHIRTEVQYLRVGPLQFITAPLELPPEIAVGLPADFDTPAGVERYYNNPTLHATGSDLVLPGVVFQTIEQLDDEPNAMQIMIGLAGDELGYAVELSDIRLVCSANATYCEHLYDIGVMNYTGQPKTSMAGSQCVDVLNEPDRMRQLYAAEFNEHIWQVANNTCVYGQKPDGYPKDHYEETNSASIILAQSYMRAVASLFDTEPKGRFCKGDFCNAVGRHECDGCR